MVESKNKKILVTGGSGLVGSHVVKILKPAYEVCHPGSSELDLLSEADIEDYLRAEGIDTVIHCAGHVGGIQANMKNPVRFLSDNTLMGFNLINSSNRAGVKELINLGSSCMYPRFAENPIKESELLQAELEPTNEGYAIAKIAAAKLCEYYTKTCSVKYKTCIPCNLYGEGDKFDKERSHLIPGVIDKIHTAKKQNKSTVTIWGTGNVRREFMYVGDLANFILYALPKIDKMPQYINVGIGTDYSINDYYHAISDIIGYEGSFAYDISKPEGMKQKLVDVSLLKNFGWNASVSLEEGIAKTYEYYKSLTN